MSFNTPENHLQSRLTLLFLSVALIASFALFVRYDQIEQLHEANVRLRNHARVIASSLWTFDRSSPQAYLTLATEANGYTNIAIFDESNQPFLVINGQSLRNFDSILATVRLIQIHHLFTDIEYEGLTIGRITVDWPDRAIYRYANIAFLIALVLIGIALLLKLIEAKHSLESRVRQRTAELENEIGERKRTEDELRAQTQRLTLHVMNTPLGVIEWNSNFEVVQWNKAAEYIFEYSKEEALGRPGADLIIPEAEREEIDSVWQQLITHVGGSRTVSTNQTKSGAVKICEWYNTTLTDQHGAINGVASLVLDVTERKQAEEKNQLLQAQLMQAQKMEAVGNLAGGIAHDFNNILQAITGNTHLLLTHIPDTNPHHARLRSIETAASRAATLVKQLLTFSRKIESNLQPVDLNHEINEVRKILERTIPKMIVIDLLLDEQLTMVRADSVQIEQVVLNLSINAMHAMPNGGTLTISTRNVFLDNEFSQRHYGAHEGPYVRLEVSDTGMGIEKHLLGHIFEPFFTTKSIGQGTGLGLSTVYGIVKSHRAYIECHSTPGSGTAFVIFFPAITDIIQTELSGTMAKDSVAGGNETILIVDDEEAIRDIGREILVLYGYTVDTAKSGEEGLDLLTGPERKPVDLIILDLNMPGMGGFKCLQRIRELHIEIPVLIASGFTPAEVIRYALEQGACGVIEKPFQLHDLLLVVRRTIDNNRNQSNETASAS